MNINLQSRPLVVAVWTFAALPWLVLLLALAILYGCAGPQARAPQGLNEQIEAASLLAAKVSDALVDVTCTQFNAGACIEPGKPLMPKDALRIHGEVERAHAALTTVASIAPGQVADCLGKQLTQPACMAAINALLIEADRYLIAKKGVK